MIKQKGEEGVEIKIIYDDLGSKRNLSSRTIKKIVNIPNLTIVNYNPLGLNINPAFNYRNHRKILIIDGEIGYIGGFNIADRYTKGLEWGKWKNSQIITPQPLSVQGIITEYALRKTVNMFLKAITG